MEGSLRVEGNLESSPFSVQVENLLFWCVTLLEVSGISRLEMLGVLKLKDLRLFLDAVHARDTVLLLTAIKVLFHVSLQILGGVELIDGRWVVVEFGSTLDRGLRCSAGASSASHIILSRRVIRFASSSI